MTLKDPNQAFAAAQHFEDYSEIGPTCTEETGTLYWITNNQSTSYPDAGEDKWYKSLKRDRIDEVRPADKVTLGLFRQNTAVLT